MTTHTMTFCGACGACSNHCRCPGGPTADYYETVRRWQEGEADMEAQGRDCEEADLKEAGQA